MGILADGLTHYLATTPREQILADWEAVAEFDNVGPTVEEFMNQTEKQKTMRYFIIYYSYRYPGNDRTVYFASTSMPSKFYPPKKFIEKMLSEEIGDNPRVDITRIDEVSLEDFKSFNS